MESVCSIAFNSSVFIHLGTSPPFFSLCQARDEEKNRRNNTDSTNQVMKDLEDLLPNQSLTPPAPPPEPGQCAVGQKQYLIICFT